MNKIALLFLVFFSCNSFSECIWSEKRPIQGDVGLFFQECAETKTIKINGIEVKPTISYELNFEDEPEWNYLWSHISPDKKTAVVYIENDKYKRNAWFINLVTEKIELFTDVSAGRHYIVKFKDNNNVTIVHGGMGYETDYYYSNTGGVWQNTGHEKINIQ